MHSASPVHIDSHAAATLRYIRTSMEAATSLAVPGSAGIAMGAIGLAAAGLSSAVGQRDHWLAIWLLAAALAAAVGGVLLARRSSLRGLLRSNTPIHRFALCLIPALFAGAILTAVLWTSGSRHAIPGTWLLLYGCALVSASAATTRTIGVLGGLFVLLGLTALALPDGWQMVLLGAGFGGLHIFFGVLISRVGHGHQS